MFVFGPNNSPKYWSTCSNETRRRREILHMKRYQIYCVVIFVSCVSRLLYLDAPATQFTIAIGEPFDKTSRPMLNITVIEETPDECFRRTKPAETDLLDIGWHFSHWHDFVWIVGNQKAIVLAWTMQSDIPGGPIKTFPTLKVYISSSNAYSKPKFSPHLRHFFANRNAKL